MKIVLKKYLKLLRKYCFLKKKQKKIDKLIDKSFWEEFV